MDQRQTNRLGQSYQITQQVGQVFHHHMILKT